MAHENWTLKTIFSLSILFTPENCILTEVLARVLFMYTNIQIWDNDILRSPRNKTYS